MATVRLRRGDLSRLLRGHPWVYASEIAGVDGAPRAGDLVELRDARDRSLGSGFYSPGSQIAVRRLDPTAVVEPGAAFFRSRVAAAWELRRRALDDASCCRVVSSEADFLPGLFVDRYDDRLVLQTLTAGMDRRKTEILDALDGLFRPRAIVERNEAPVREIEGLERRRGMLHGTEDDARLVVGSAGVRFAVDLLAGHKGGLYLDQRENHGLVARHAAGRRVLDAFAYEGGFALHCAAHGAAAVTAVEISPTGAAALADNARLNGLERAIAVVERNAFDFLKEADAGAQRSGAPPYELVVLDPPSFTRSRANVAAAGRGYKEIHLRACRLLGVGGLLATFCCAHHVARDAFERIVVDAAADARRTLRRVASLGQPADHPVLPAVPETEYLKGFLYEVVA